MQTSEEYGGAVVADFSREREHGIRDPYTCSRLVVSRARKLKTKGDNRSCTSTYVIVSTIETHQEILPFLQRAWQL